jgi:hypothetical protein
VKLRLLFKTPDVTDAVEAYVVKHCEVHDEYDQGCTACIDRKQEAKYEVQDFKEQLRKFVEYDEYVTIEFDTETKTATVVPVRG